MHEEKRASAAVTLGGEPDVDMTQEATASTAVTLNSDPDIIMVDDDDDKNSDLPTEDDDNVTEYSFTSEDYPHQSELEDSDEEDARSHISLSSTDEPEVTPLNGVVWKDLTPSQRMSYEHMFGSLPREPLNGSWSFTEDYQAEVDQQCIDYIKVFELEKWVVSPQEARATFEGVLDRLRKRANSMPIFGDRNIQLHPGHTLHSQPLMQAVPPGVNIGQPRHQHQPFPFAQQQQQQQHFYHQQQQQFQNAGLPMGMHPGPMRGTAYMPQQGQPGMQRQLMMNDPNVRGFRNAPPMMITKPAIKAPTPPYPTRARPDFRKTVGKSNGRGGKTRRQAETDEFPWNRPLNFVEARDASKTEAAWDYSAYERATLDRMNRTRQRNEPILAALEMEITMKQKQSRNQSKAKGAQAKPDASSDDDGEREVEADREVEVEEDGEGGLSTKGGRKKSRAAGEAGNDPYHSGNFAFATDEDTKLAASMGMHAPEMLIEAGEADKLPLDKLSAIKICWSPGKKGNSQDLEQAVFSIKDTVVTRKMLAKTPILNHRAGECIIDFCPDLLWRDILLRILSEAGFSNKDVRDRACLNGSFSDRATIAKRLGAALGKDTNPPRGSGKEATLDWCETNRDDFDNYQAFFGKRPPARRTAQGRKKRLGNVKAGESEGDNSPSKDGEKGVEKKISTLALDGAADDESAMEDSDDDDAVSLQDSDDLDAMSD